MLRRRANLAAVLSLALCVGTAALWIRSYWYEDQLKHAGADGVVDWLILSDHGVLLFDRFDSPVDYQDGYLEREATRFDEPVKFALRWGTGGFGDPWPQPDRGFKWMGFVYAPTYKVVAAPHWFVAAATSLLPVICATTMRRARRRAAAGLCPSCGYDVRATPERCPECGATQAPRSLK